MSLGVGAPLARGPAGRYTDRLGPRTVALGAFAFVAVTAVMLAFVTARTSPVWPMVALLVRGVAQGAAMIAPAGAAYAGLAHREIPDASVITRVAQQIGGSVGIAVLAVVLRRGTAHARTPAALAHGFDVAFWWSAALTNVVLPLCLLLPSRPEAAPSGEKTEARSTVRGLGKPSRVPR
ncbi:MFS transporter [Streptacidiphilus melanogenes]|uniref:MFS transporter n=1 Tax=Streptacidiphilus melanogenes TaxID=411235 RepID=UPI0006933C15|nr:MFS transporter [Streptacidiphilus melanogenes]